MGAMMNFTQRLKDRGAATATLDLRRRVKALEEEVQECRALNLRLAELTDVVTELLLPIAQRDEEKLRDAIARYQEGI
jgi:hypothetical protein